MGPASELQRPLALTMGDPAGIGLELALLAWLKRDSDGIPPFVLYGDADALGASAKRLHLDVPLAVVDSARQVLDVFPSHLPVRPVDLAARPEPGAADVRNAPAIIEAIERAVADTLAGEAGAVVTNPIAKSVLLKAGFAHPGHTEFLGELARRHTGAPHTAVMMLAASELRVVPLTVHIPLSRVPAEISREGLMATARILDLALRRDFGVARPRIAVTGLNPHAGEDGALGDEEQTLISPAVAELKREGLLVTGPYPADTLFHSEARTTYDAVLAMYHDQALIPLKTLAFDRGVNVTLGLPFVRTSPDHGTAFDIAGLGRANPRSLIEALKLAQVMATSRASRAARSAG